ncbi:hypothetical protein HRG_002015 [Hirsutella rhossiliensis]
MWDDEVFHAFQQDFEGWTLDMFLMVEISYRRELRRVLRRKGVYTGTNHQRIERSLIKLLEADSFPTWDPEEFTKQIFDPYKALPLYTGEPYDLLDDKMKIFFNICFHAQIRETQFYAVFPRILNGRAETFYLHYVDQDDTFAIAYHKVKTHFDTDVNHHHYYTDWTTATFELFDPTKHRGTRIFKSRLVREVKGKYIKPYEKSRLVVQGYNDDEKNTL